ESDMARLAKWSTLGIGLVAAALLANIGVPAWHRALGHHERGQMLERLSRELDDGALGIGILLGYCRETPGEEYLEIAALAAQTRAPTFTHVRDLGRPDSGLLGAQEVVAAASSTGAHMHLCHINSTSVRTVDHVHALLDDARARGVRVTTEAYPYGSGATGIGAQFLDPGELAASGRSPTDIVYLPGNERIQTAARLRELRAQDPGGLAIVEFLREERPEDLGYLTRALLHHDTAVASDAMPLAPDDPTRDVGWPVPAGTATHPRTAGTFARIFRWYVRELQILDLAEAVRRCTIVPAQILQTVSADMGRKGRVQAGADADLVIFDPATITDRATYASPVEPSSGFSYVMVNGTPVVKAGALQVDVLPGLPVRGGR
ncbi:MAG: amidohydrolase family protein, partial [Actinomycetales bacterium]